LPAATVELVRRSLKGETFVSTDEAFRTLCTVPHGHVEAVLKMIHKLGFDSLIALKAGKTIGRYKMAKHFMLTIEDGMFEYRRDEASIERERQLDGIYIVRTGEPAQRLSAEDAVRDYKRLAEVEVYQPEYTSSAGLYQLAA